MTSKSPDQTLLEAHNLNRWAAKNPDQLLSDELFDTSSDMSLDESEEEILE